METGSGARLANLLFETFELMVDEVLVELDRRGHPGLTVANEFAMQAIDAGAATAADLARALAITRQAAAKTITSLEELGYVARVADAADARRKKLRLTAHGRRAISIGSSSFDRIRDRWVESAGQRQVAATEKALSSLRDRLRIDAHAAPQS